MKMIKMKFATMMGLRDDVFMYLLTNKEKQQKLTKKFEQKKSNIEINANSILKLRYVFMISNNHNTLYNRFIAKKNVKQLRKQRGVENIQFQSNSSCLNHKIVLTCLNTINGFIFQKGSDMIMLLND